MKYSVATMVKAIQESKGMVTIAARRIGCSVTTVNNYRRRYPAIDQAIHDERESMTDAAELALYRKITEGEGWAVCFYLKTQGKGRGYVERREITGADGAPVVIEDARAALLRRLTPHNEQVTEDCSDSGADG